MTVTLLSLAIIWLAVLPGALFVWAFEQQVGRWTTGIGGGILRSAGHSAVFHFLFAPFTYYLWSHYWDDIARGNRVSLWLWGALAVYTIVPIILGLLVGRSIKRENRWATYFTGIAPAPRAWDFLFGRAALSGWVLIHTKSGRSIVGFYGKGSYAAGYPEMQDIYLSYIIDENIAPTDLRKNGANKQRGLLIRWDEVEYLELIPSD